MGAKTGTNFCMYVSVHEFLNSILDIFFILNSTLWQYEGKNFHIDGDMGRVKVCG